MFSEDIKRMLKDNSNDNNPLYIYSRTYRLKLSYLKDLNREFKSIGLKVLTVKASDIEETLRHIDDDVDVLIITEVSMLKLDNSGQNKLFLALNEILVSNKKLVITSKKQVDKLNNINKKLIKLFNKGKKIELKYN